jgi:hypothetical protein
MIPRDWLADTLALFCAVACALLLVVIGALVL